MIFPINPNPEKFIDPDERFKSLPYYEEIPEPSNRPMKFAPILYTYGGYMTCRERCVKVALTGWFAGYFIFGFMMAKYKFGYCVNRWRLVWCEFGTASLLATASIIHNIVIDMNCSPYLSGRRRELEDEEAVRHALNAKYHLEENIERIMHTRHRITKEEFFESFMKAKDQTSDNM